MSKAPGMKSGPITADDLDRWLIQSSGPHVSYYLKSEGWPVSGSLDMAPVTFTLRRQAKAYADKELGRRVSFVKVRDAVEAAIKDASRRLDDLEHYAVNPKAKAGEYGSRKWLEQVKEANRRSLAKWQELLEVAAAKLTK